MRIPIQQFSFLTMMALIFWSHIAFAETVPNTASKTELTAPTRLAQAGSTATTESIKFQAKLTEKDTSPITSNLVWRIFQGKLPLNLNSKIIFESKDPTLSAILPAGDYVVNVTYGRVTGFKQVSTAEGAINDTIILNAGGVKFSADVAGKPILPSKVNFSIYTHGAREADRKLILADVKAGAITRLPAGEYYVTSRYGDGNAVISTDVTVTAGKLTEAIVHHRAGTIILKLVNEVGAEALANTSWTILTPNGDTVAEFVGAYVTTTLLEGDYVVVARYESRVYNSQFSVESGNDKEVEILAK